MMENLRLDNTATELSSNNTNNPVSSFVSLSQSNDSWCLPSEYSDASICINQSRVNTNNTNIDGANSSNVALIVKPGGWDYQNDVDGYDGEIGIDGDIYQWYGYGNYYNWYSATAGNGLYSTTGEDAAGDICPMAWSLPTKGNYSYLDTALHNQGNNPSSPKASRSGDRSETINEDKWRQYPNNLVFSGRWFRYGADERGYRGSYWTRSASNSGNYAYALFSSNYDGTNPATASTARSSGLSIRCLTR